MISRRKILSRSRDELNVDFTVEDEEDVWYHTDKLFKDHIQEVLNKWDQIDDEIWAKIICMERNRRVAKAYARAPVLTINGSNEGFDGFRIGLCGFDNPMRDPKTEEVKKQVGHGVKIKMDDGGNIMIKRVSKSNVYIKEIAGENNSVSTEIIRSNGLLELDKPVKLFEMKKFQQNVSRELKRAYPDRRHLEAQCISCVSFVKDSHDLLDCPCWVMVINIVALDMLKSKLPPPMAKRQSAPNLMSIFERSRLPLPEEDPYSLPGSTPRNQYPAPKEPRPPKLPPRDLPRVNVPRPDYEDHRQESNSRSSSSSNRKKIAGYYDDPYYCGLKARVPNFGKRGPEPVPHPLFRNQPHSQAYLSLFKAPDRSIYDSGYGSCSTATNHSHMHTGSSDEDYSKIYGRIRSQPTTPSYHLAREVYVGEWE